MILGIDVGYSLLDESCSYCILNTTSDRIIKIESIDNFNLLESSDIFKKVLTRYDEIQSIYVDSPITQQSINKFDKNIKGRKIEKLFSSGVFSSTYTGVRPNSVQNNRMGLNLNAAGVYICKVIKDLDCRFNYHQYSEISKELVPNSIYEVIPKLTQALLLPSDLFQERSGRNIDELAFHRLFGKDNNFKIINTLLGDHSFGDKLKSDLLKMSENTSQHHEKIGSFIASLQGFLHLIGSAETIGFKGEHEGYFVLPNLQYWNQSWIEDYKVKLNFLST